MHRDVASTRLRFLNDEPSEEGGFFFQLASVQDIDAVAKRIKDRGGKLETEPADMPWGVRAFRVLDPDGYKFSVSSPRPGT